MVGFCEQLGRVGIDKLRSRARIARVLSMLAFGGLSLALGPVASASASSFTWAGGSAGRTESAAHWSAGANWEGNTPPTTSQMIETLTFPHLTNSECMSKPETDTCYLTLNDISGLTVGSMQLDDADNYLLAGEKITLGSGGLTATPTSGTGFAGSFMEMPLELNSSQKWSIANRSGGEIEENGLLLGGEVTGEGSELTVELTNGPALVLENSTEVGPVTIEGLNTSGEHVDNGLVLLEEGELNSADRHPVDLRNVFFAGAGAVGALTTNSGTLDVGNTTGSAGALKASSVTLDSTSAVIFGIMGGGTTAQVDYSQMVSAGPVNLAGPIVVVVRKPSEKAPCPVLSPGQKYTFVSTSGTLLGTFSNALDGGPEIQIAFTKSCSHPLQTMRISYNRDGGTETVTGTVEAQTKERQEEEGREQETKEQEAKQKEEATRKLVEEHAKTVGEEAVAAEAAATKKREEGAAAAVAKKRQEEEAAAAATKKRQEEEGSVVGSVTLGGSTITVHNGSAGVKLTCTGLGTCGGKLTLTAKGTAKKGKKAKTETIGTASFSILGGTTATVRLVLNAAGKALLSADHGRLGATLSILKSSPAPSQMHTYNVHLAQRKVHGKAKK
jgi:hypothetical protein